MVTKPKKIHPLKNKTSYIHMSLVCASGWGKTVFSGSASKALFLTTDPEGTLSAFTVIGSDADEWEIEQWEDFDEVYPYMRDGGCDEYDFLIVDNGSEAQNLAKNWSRSAAVKRKPASRMPYSFDKPDYGVAQEALTQLVLKFHDLPIHVIWTWHMKGMEDEDGESYYSAAIQGGNGEIAQRILGYMNIIGMGEVITKEVDGVEKEVRRLWFTHHNEFRGKDRFNVLGRFRDDLTVPRMMGILQKSGVLAGAPAKAPTGRKPAAVKRTPAATKAPARTNRKKA